MKRLFSMTLGLAVALSALQAQNTVTVGDVELKKGASVTVSVELTNELAFTAFQMDLALPEGFSVPTIINEDEEEVLDIALNASRKKSSHQLTSNVLDDGRIRIASYSSTNATLKGTSGEIVSFRIVAADEVVEGNYTASLSGLLFSTPEPAVEYDLGSVDFQIVYEEDNGDIEPVEPKRSVEVNAGQYGRCVFEGNVIEPNGLCTLSEAFEDGAAIKLFFVPFEGYTAKSMKRNGVEVTIKDNMYEEVVSEDVVFSDVYYSTYIPEVEELPVPVIACEDGIVTITCEESDVIILYAINGNPLEGGIYTAPFEVTEDAVISAVAVRKGEIATLAVIGTDITRPQVRIVSQRYYNEDGVEMTSPEDGVTIVSTEYEDGTKSVYKMVKR